MSDIINTNLIECAKNGNLEGIRRLLSDGADVNYRCPPDGTTALYWSACNGHLSICDWLVRHGAEVNLCAEKSGSIPLHGAADRGHADCVLLLVRKGSYIDARTISNGDTPLHLAAYRGHLGVCRVLLQNGATADAVNAQGCTPLDESQTQQHYDIYQLLWKHRQRQTRTIKQGNADTCLLLSGASGSTNLSNLTKRNKLITDVISSSSPSLNRSQVDTLENGCQQSTAITRHQTSSLVDDMNSSNDSISSRNISSDFGIGISEFRVVSESTSDLQKEKSQPKKDENTSVPPCPSCSRTSSKTADVTQSSSGTGDVKSSISKQNAVVRDMMHRLDEMAAYSSELQIQLTIRDDENEKLVEENETLVRKIEILKSVSETIEESNQSRVESELRALRAEKELIALRQRYEALEKANIFLQNQLLLQTSNEDRNSVVLLSSFNELQPRG